MSKRRSRVDPGALRRDLRRHQEGKTHWLKDIGFFTFPFLVAGWEILRVATSPIRGTSVWLDGVLVGLVAGVVAVASCGVFLARRGRVAGALTFGAGVLLALLLLTSSGSKSHTPAVTDGYLAGAVTYGAVGMSGLAILAVQMIRDRLRA